MPCSNHIAKKGKLGLWDNFVRLAFVNEGITVKVQNKDNSDNNECLGRGKRKWG